MQRPNKAAAWPNKGLLSPKTGKNLSTGRKWGSWLGGVIPPVDVTRYAACTYVRPRLLPRDNLPPVSMVRNRSALAPPIPCRYWAATAGIPLLDPLPLICQHYCRGDARKTRLTVLPTSVIADTITTWPALDRLIVFLECIR